MTARTVLPPRELPPGPIILTGAAGFIGRRVTRLLAGGPERPAYPVLAADLVRPRVPTPGVEWRVTSIADQEFLNEARSLAPSAIVHLASITNSMIQDRSHMLDRNVGEFEHLLGLAEAIGARVVFASSAAVYGNGAVPMREAQTPRPHNPYALSKHVMEQRAADAARRGLSVLALRFFNVYGPGEEHKQASASMVFQLHRALTRGEPVRVFRDGEQSRDFVHVDDVALAVRTALNPDVTGVLNIGSGQPTTFNELIAMLAAATATRPRVEYLDEPSWEYQRHTWASLELSRERLAFRPRPLHAGLRDLIRQVGEPER